MLNHNKNVVWRLSVVSTDEDAPSLKDILTPGAQVEPTAKSINFFIDEGKVLPGSEIVSFDKTTFEPADEVSAQLVQHAMEEWNVADTMTAAQFLREQTTKLGLV